ncbi:MAG: glycosyltransferase family 1 protein [Chloroflexota bacterium]
MMTRKVAIFTETFLPKIDGMVTITCLLLEHLRRVDADVMLFASGNRVDEYAGYPVVSMRGLPVPIYPELELALPGPRVRQQLADFNPDVIHVMNPVMSGLCGIQFAKQMQKPLVMSFHTHLMEMARFYGYGILEDTLWYLHRLGYKHADAVLATSKHAAADLEAHGISPVSVWRRGVDVERFSPDFATDEMRRRLTRNHPERTVLLSAGRLAPEKQVEQIKHVLDAAPCVHLAIVGDGPYRAKLEDVYRGYPVTFVGYMSGDDLSSAYASADIFVFPSSSIETFGLVAAEAMASGLATVASRVGGMPELIAHGENGYLFAENDTAHMVELVRDMVEHPEKRQQFGVAGRKTLSVLSWTVIMDELFALYDDVIAEKASKARVRIIV